MALFDILNVNPAQNVQPYSVDPTLSQQGLLGLFAQLGQVGARGIAQAAGRDLRSPQTRINEASANTEFTPEGLVQLAARLDAAGEGARAATVRQLAAQMKAEQEAAKSLAGRDRYVAVGSSIFDMVERSFMQSPSRDDIDSMSQNEIAQLYRHFTGESVQAFLDDPTKTLVPIPTGDSTEEMTEEQIRARTLSQLQSVDAVLANINDAENQNIWQFGYDLTKFIPQTNARQLRGYVSSIQSALAFDRLQRMKDESKTGGALGQVSNIELELLKNNVASLDPAAGNFAEQLEKVKMNYQNFKNSLLGLDPVGPDYIRGEDGNLYYYNSLEDAWINLTAQAGLAQ